MIKPGTPFIGDLLLSFGAVPASLPARFSDSPWQPFEHGPGWQLWSSTPCSDWKGFPVRMLAGDEWKVYSLGEFQPSSTNHFHPDRLSREIDAFPGRLLVLAWEARTRCWHIWTDRFATLHAYRAGRTLGTFSPSVAAFTPRTLDWHALGGFFGFGFFPRDHTHFEGLSILRPASHYILDWNGDLVSQARYWHWRYQPELDRSYRETVDEFQRIFTMVMADISQDGRIAIPISGGLDSRSTVAAIPRIDSNDSRFWSYSYGYSIDSIETRIASQVAAARQLPFQSFTIQPYLFHELSRLLAWTEGFQDLTQGRQAFVRDELAHHADTLVAALWGDVWLDDSGLAGKAAASLNIEAVTTHALHKMQKKGRLWLLENLVHPRLDGKDPEQQLLAWVQPEMEALQEITEPDFRIKAYKTEQWSFRWSLAPLRIFQSAAWPRLVFYDSRMVDFFCSVPTHFLTGRRLQVDYLKRFAPDLARIPWQPYDSNLFDYKGFNSWLLPRRAAKKVLRLLSGEKVVERNWEVQFLDPQGRSGLEKWLISPGLRLHEFVSPAKVKRLLDDFYLQPDASAGYTVSMLLTFSTWLEKFG